MKGMAADPEEFDMVRERMINVVLITHMYITFCDTQFDLIMVITRISIGLKYF